MKNFLNKLFHLEEKKTNIKTELLGGAVTFIAICYILPVNAALLSSMGMSREGVFAATALVSFIVTMIMGLVANYPLVLSTGMGLNAFLVYSLSAAMGYTWQQSMILLTIAGLIFFLLSVTSIRKKIIEAIPKDLRAVISASLGAFIIFVGLKSSGIIVSSSSTVVALGSFADPGMLIGLVAIVLCFGLLATKKKMISVLAIPIAIAFAAIVGVTVSSIMYGTGAIERVAVGDTYSFIYNTGITQIDNCPVNLPIAPWISNVKWGASGLKDVFFYGLMSSTGDYTSAKFGEDIVNVLTRPITYVGIFSLVFVNLFDTTAAVLAVGNEIGAIDEEGHILRYQRTVLADEVGGMICAPMGTSMVTSFAESSVGVSLGARTGLAAVAASLLFLLSTFVYPIFSIFTSGSVTACALVVVGAIIIRGAIKNLNHDDMISNLACVVGVLFAVLTYSITNGIGISLLVYVVMMVFAGRGKEIKLPIYIITGLFVISFALTTILTLV